MDCVCLALSPAVDANRCFVVFIATAVHVEILLPIRDVALEDVYYATKEGALLISRLGIRRNTRRFGSWLGKKKGMA